MASTGKTTKYELPLFQAQDIPQWMTDWNNAMETIDTALAGIDPSGEDNETIKQLQDDLTAVQTKVASQESIFQQLYNGFDFAKPTVTTPPEETGGEEA